MLRSVPVIAILLYMPLFVDSNLAVGQESSKGPERFESEISKLEAKLKEGKTSRGGLLFVGSSSIRLWKLNEAFPEHHPINHGFGGSTLADVIHYFDRVVTPVRPATIVIYGGDNDLAAGKSPEVVTEDFRTLISLIQKSVPDCKKVVYVAIKPSIKRWNNAAAITKTNAAIQEHCRMLPLCHFVDIWPLMLDADGQPRADLLVEDGLHLNEKGYAIWNKVIAPLLAKP